MQHPRVHHFSLTLFATLIATLLTTAATTARTESLDTKINALLASELVKNASVGISIVEIKPNRPPAELYAHNANLPLGPASNCKLLTTAAAFEKYGAKANLKTLLYKVGDDLLIVGGGDPGLGDAKLLGENKITEPFIEWADVLQKAGITQYRDLIVDDRVFDQQWTHPDWPADQRLHDDQAPIGGLSFNINCLDWIPKSTKAGVTVELFPNTSYVSVNIKAKSGAETLASMIRPPESNKFELRGTVSPAGASSNGAALSVPIYDPGLWTATILRDTLSENAIKQTGTVRRPNPGEKFPGATLIAQHDTPLLTVMARANKNSVNMIAETLCKRLGHDATNEPGSWENGTAAVKAYLKSIGADPNLATLDDGSGLSHKNLVAPKVFTTVLAHVANAPDGDDFIATLAQPGEEGTLKHRFKGMSVAEHIHAKTGHINGVSTLSGYIEIGEGPAKRLYAFSILCNKYQGNVNSWQDEVCQALYTWATAK